MYLTLDLSSKCVGWAKFTNDGRLMKKGRISPDKKIENFFKIHYLVEKIKELYSDVDELIIEDLFYGKNFKSVIYLARLSGAVIYSWIVKKYKIPHFYMAVRARSLAGVSGRAHKAEVQLFVLEKYKFTPKTKIQQYQEIIDELTNKYKSKKIRRGQFKYRMDKISASIDKKTKIGEDIADAIVLGLAYQEDKK